MKGKLLVLIAICLASALGLISLGVPQLTTTTVTVTFSTTLTRSQAITLTSPFKTTMPFYCGFNVNCVAISSARLSTTVTVSVVQTWTSYSPLSPYSYTLMCFPETNTVAGYTYTYSTSHCVEIVAIPVIEIVSPIISTLMTASSMTSSMTSTTYMTELMPLISTGSAYQEIAIALIAVLAVCVVMAVLQKGKHAQA